MYIKDKLKSEILITKTFTNKIFFSVITKNLDYKNLTKNLVTFKKWDGVKDHNFILWEFDFYGMHEKPIHLGELPKKVARTVCRFKKRLGKKEGVIFLRGVETQMHNRS